MPEYSSRLSSCPIRMMRSLPYLLGLHRHHRSMYRPRLINHHSDLDSDPSEDDSPNEDLTKTAESLHTQTILTSRSRSPSPLQPPAVPLPPPAVPLPPPATAVPLPPERVESVGDDIKNLHARLASAKQDTVTLRARVGSLELEILKLRSRAEYVETRLERSHDRPTGDGVRTQRAVMTEQEVEALCARDEATEFLRAMKTTNQGLSFAKIEQIVAMRVASAIETIAIYEARTRVARDSRNQVERQEDNVVENASKKRKWEGDHSGSSS
ncbi:hypothetical protein Tco_0592517 [Tanacetum coccineum]